MTEITKADAQRRLARIAGQVNGIRVMLAEDRYCVDLLTQIAAVRSALDQLGVVVLTSHIETCVAGHGTGTEHEACCKMSQSELVDEVRTTLKRFLK